MDEQSCYVLKTNKLIKELFTKFYVGYAHCVSAAGYITFVILSGTIQPTEHLAAYKYRVDSSQQDDKT